MTNPLQRVPDFQLLLHEQQYRAVGHMVVQWAFLEGEINSEIAGLLSRSEHRGKSVNFQSRFSARANEWIKLARRSYKKHPSRIKAVERIIGHANNIKPERDDIVHGGLAGSGLFFKLRNGRTMDISDFIGEAPHIEDLACRISTINAEIFRHQQQLRKHYRKVH